GGTARVGRLEVERAVGSLLVVVPDVDAEDMLELALAEDQEPVEAFAADAADPAFHVGVGVWRPDGRADDLDVLTRQEGVEARGNFASRSWIRKRTVWSWSSSSIRRLRACCSIQAVSGLLVQAKYS